MSKKLVTSIGVVPECAVTNIGLNVKFGQILPDLPGDHLMYIPAVFTELDDSVDSVELIQKLSDVINQYKKKEQ